MTTKLFVIVCNPLTYLVSWQNRGLVALSLKVWQFFAEILLDQDIFCDAKETKRRWNCQAFSLLDAHVALSCCYSKNNNTVR